MKTRIRKTLSLVAIGLAMAFPSALVCPAQAGKAAAPTKPPAAILGVHPGMDVDDARQALEKQGASSGKPQDKDADKDADKDMDKKDMDKDIARPPKSAASGEDDDEGHQEVWRLSGTAYSQIALASDDKGHILWVTGFVRPGKEIPFTTLGSTQLAAAVKPAFAVWNVIVPFKSYRVIARGRGGKASVVTMLTLAMANPNGIFSPAVVPSAKH